MTPYTYSSSNSDRANVHKRRGIVFTDESKNVSQRPSKPIGQESSAETDDYKGPTCYDKPSWDVPHDGHNSPDYNTERRFGSVSTTSLSNAATDVLEYGGLSTPGRRIKNPEAINMLQRTMNQVESHNKAFEKALMWRSYYKSLRYNSSKGSPKGTNDST